MNPNDPRQALEILDRVAGGAGLSRADHVAVQIAVQTLRTLIEASSLAATDAPPVKPEVP